ncbi:MAG: hypothetical protein DRP09_15405 [Candidatus Thorarchaeota archaeon]|nr:MAG: hypothetical protein DRP09_15405 [Candidatus Thorarchaeota archaeon]
MYNKQVMAKVIEPKEEFKAVRTVGEAITFEKRGNFWKVRRYQKTPIRNPEFKKAYIQGIEQILKEYSALPEEEKQYWETEAQKVYMEGWQLYKREQGKGIYETEYGSNYYGRLRYM